MAGNDALNAAIAAAGCAGGVLSVVYILKMLTDPAPERKDTKDRQSGGRRGRRHARDEDFHDDASLHDDYNSHHSKRRVQASKTRFYDDEPMQAGWQGFSMVEARELAEACQQRQRMKSPQEVLADLQKGNMRFWNGHAARPERSAFERRAMISKQFPTVAILGCADSRVPVEIVFDAGLGDVHVTRVAGNCLDTASLASLQYAVNHLKVKVLLVMGHEGCGAIKAAGLTLAQIEQEPLALSRLLTNLKAGLDARRLDSVEDARARDREAVISNVKRQLEFLKQDTGIVQKIKEGELICVGAIYEISSGIVDFFSEITASSL
eukprot:TRINITY_DN303_c0_g2_i1.p1 TRINITY_DN303_c0_g2~~TRINITY_DN303_c0_g2_i1.p1  ORF type:complete len:322 (-),score=91.97 TRINITY_DN303_c0_g2_i1:464-1429(-)